MGSVHIATLATVLRCRNLEKKMKKLVHSQNNSEVVPFADRKRLAQFHISARLLVAIYEHMAAIVARLLLDHGRRDRLRWLF